MILFGPIYPLIYPKKTLPGVKGEIRVIQELHIKVESLILKGATTMAVLKGLRRHELIHFACHGILLVTSVCGHGKSLVLDQCIRHLCEECILYSRTS
jgi:CHAT domain-containing protein